MTFDRRLGRVFGFDADDLRANRSGRLSDQQARLFANAAASGRRRTRVVLPLFFGLLIGTVVLALATSGPETVGALAVVGVMGGFMVLLVAVFARRSARDEAVKAAGEVVAVEAPVTLDTIRDGFWIIAIGPFTFAADEDGYGALEDGGTYRAHLLPTEPHALLLSIERP